MTSKWKHSFISRMLAGTAILSLAAIGTAHASDLGVSAKDPQEPYVIQEPEKWNEWTFGNSTLDFHGYFRYGYGWDQNGDPMPSFQAPGSLSKYRLGNEDVQGGEIVFDYRYYLDGVPRRGASPNSRYIQLQGRWEDFESIQNLDELYIEFNNDHTKEAYVSFGNFIGDGTNVWFGRRFYDRKDIHIIDHFWLNVAQGSDFGGGIEGIKAWDDNTIDIAAFYAYDEGAELTAEGPVDENINSYMLDVRLRGLDTMKDGKLTLIGQLGYRPAYEETGGLIADGIAVDDQFGFALGAYHELANTWGGRMNTGFIFRQGAAMVQNDFNSRAPTEIQGYDLSEAYSIEANNDLVIQPSESWAMQWAAVARYEDFGSSRDAAGDSILWLSTGIRPVYYFLPQVNIAFESGIDWVDNQRIGVEGHVWKNTIALQFQEKPGYFERPVFRAFATWAEWSDDLEGTVGGTNFNDDTDGFVVGVQLESWW